MSSALLSKVIRKRTGNRVWLLALFSYLCCLGAENSISSICWSLAEGLRGLGLVKCSPFSTLPVENACMNGYVVL